MNMQNTAKLLITSAAALAIAGCSSGGTNPVAPAHVANLSANTLQFNVGTANIYGTPGLNVAVTYRQPTGQSATLVNSPTLTLPSALAGPAGAASGYNTVSTILTGPAPAEVGTTSMTSTSQGTTASNVTTFGVDGGAFGIGIEPFNYVYVTGVPASVVPYPVPLYDTINNGGGMDPNQFIPGGGLPAFDPAGNTAAVLGGFNGISEGIDTFQVAPVVGSYSLGINVPANSGAVTQTATAAITSAALLPVIAPAVPTAVAANGGATFTFVLPAGVTEAYIQVTDLGPTAADGVSCVGATLKKPVYYTIEATASGTGTLPAGSLCSATANNTAGTTTDSDGDQFQVQSVGFDYPAYEASYPNSLGKASPSIVGLGASHQSDITISTKTQYTLPVAGGAPVGTAVTPAAVLRRK